MNEILKERLNKIILRITSREFLEGGGLGNEIGFFIFDYLPEDELHVREHIQVILDQVEKKHPDIKIHTVNLFELIIQYLKDRNLLDKAIRLQKEKGDKELMKALKAPLHEEKIAKVFRDKADPDNCDIVFMTGVGSAWPLLRSHTLLNNLHPLMNETPLVVFYPGLYDGQGLSLFGKLEDDNYYRAFRLVP